MVKNRIFEVKVNSTALTSAEKKEQKENPRRHTTVRVDGENPLHDAREFGRNAKKFLDNL